MKPICDLCSHQKAANDGGVICGNMNDDFGGASCVHDSYLKDNFTARTGAEISIRNLSARHRIIRSENNELKYKVSELERKLIKLVIV